MNYKVIGSDHREYGPISGEQVRQWIIERRLNAVCLAQPEGTPDWRPLATFPEFQTLLASAAPPALPLPPPAPYYAPGYPRTNSLAVAGLIMGILTVTLGACCYGFPFNILGIVFSAVGLSQINQNPHVERGHGLAIAGLVLSLLGTFVVLLIMLLGLTVSMISSAESPRFHS